MKTLKIFSASIILLLIAQFSFAQNTSTESFNVSGVCGMCKKKIEKAAKDAGATYAVWSTQTKVLTIRYNSVSTNTAKIQQSVANAGYDTPQYKATDDAYNKLDKCCQYDRSENSGDKTSATEASCCDKSSSANGKMDCCKKDANGKTTAECCNSSKSTTTKKAHQ